MSNSHRTVPGGIAGDNLGIDIRAAPDEAIAVICEELPDVGGFKDYPRTAWASSWR